MSMRRLADQRDGRMHARFYFDIRLKIAGVLSGHVYVNDGRAKAKGNLGVPFLYPTVFMLTTTTTTTTTATDLTEYCRSGVEFADRKP